MRGLMQETPLNVCQILDHAAKWHPEQLVVSRSVEGPTVSYTYVELHRRAKLCAMALGQLGVRPGSFVATLAWNTSRHMEAWYGIMGCGAVCHTLNPRLSPKDLTYIAHDAQDEVLLADATMVPILEKVLPGVPSVRHVVLLTDRLHMPPPASLAALGVPVHCYEELLGAAAGLPGGAEGFSWVQVDENDACGMCYTSGTTGNPKGVLYSHRSNYLHALLLLQADSLPLSAADCCLAVVPMFHANSWGLVFAAPMVRGPATVARYFKAHKPAIDGEGWFPTGDVASIDQWGYMQITDRSKDVIKSGGEWISSIEIENLAMGYPGVAEAAVVAVPDDRWGERPLLVLVPRPGVEPGAELRDGVLSYLATKLAKFAVPDDAVFVPQLPHNATGKVSKLTLRDMFRSHRAPPRAKL
ncbi:hypothetical protein GPECTOR_7g951 [Gonium pectorale]|uniref:AMP-dependent synthetase/ligase domain-containing protein n=1 Tax=Gonium pectorale TaxID=33097 RepID=A0A150GUJ8_GONPE|nr:hypothetical protein GPECTOR_7g951 [Gonium pectorale]|eukprot:KXZ53501.1 hypothetical protein GPECTOR_7g951 [Gonium pectorale]